MPADAATLSATEARVAAAWAELLGSPVTSPQADFFALGGHSLLATRLIATLRRDARCALDLRDLFADPTVAGLAAASTAAPQADRRDTTAAVVTRTAAPLSWGQERLWFLEQLDPGNPAYHIAFTLELEGPLERQALALAVNDLARRHEALRTHFPVAGGQPSQAIASSVAIELADCLRRAQRPRR